MSPTEIAVPTLAELKSLKALHEASTEAADSEYFCCPRCNHAMMFDGQDTMGFCNDCAQGLIDQLPGLIALAEEALRMRPALKQCVQVIGRDSLGDEDFRAAWDRGREALARGKR